MIFIGLWFLGAGSGFIDVSDPHNPVQVWYFVPDGSDAATPAVHDGLIYAAQYSTGTDVIRFTPAGAESVRQVQSRPPKANQ